MGQSTPSSHEPLSLGHHHLQVSCKSIDSLPVFMALTSSFSPHPITYAMFYVYQLEHWEL